MERMITPAATTSLFNGVNFAQFSDIIDAIKANPTSLFNGVNFAQFSDIIDAIKANAALRA
jgi:hypothetical protein